MANPQLQVRAVGSGGQLDVNVLSPDDNVGYAFGTDSDAVFYLSSAVIAAGSETTGLHAGASSVKQATAVDSLIISNITTDGDLQMLVSDGDSKEFLFADGSAANLVLGHGMDTATLKTASGNLTLNPGGDLDCSSNDLINVGASGNDWTDTTFTHSGDGQCIVTRTTDVSGATTTFAWTIMHENPDHDMTTGFAVSLAFRLKDDESAAMNMARIDGAWNGADDSGKMTMYTYDSGAATASFDVLPGGIDLLNNTLLNVGASGNDWTDTTFTHSGTGQGLMERETGSTGAITFVWTLIHKSTGDAGNGFGPALAFRISDTGVSQSNIGRIEFIRADNSDSTGDFQVVPYVSGAANTALKLTSAGTLSVDVGSGTGTDGSTAGQYTEILIFDQYDDATELQRFAYSMPGISTVVPEVTEEMRLANRDRLLELGVLKRVEGALSGIHVNVQPMMNLLAGGIYQNRHRMDSQYDELSKRLEAIGA